MQAAKILIAEGLLDAKDVSSGTDGYREPTSDFIDGLTYDGKRPLEYLKSHTIGNKD